MELSAYEWWNNHTSKCEDIHSLPQIPQTKAAIQILHKISPIFYLLDAAPAGKKKFWQTLIVFMQNFNQEYKYHDPIKNFPVFVVELYETFCLLNSMTECTLIEFMKRYISQSNSLFICYNLPFLMKSPTQFLEFMADMKNKIPNVWTICASDTRFIETFYVHFSIYFDNYYNDAQYWYNCLLISTVLNQFFQFSISDDFLNALMKDNNYTLLASSKFVNSIFKVIQRAPLDVATTFVIIIYDLTKATLTIKSQLQRMSSRASTLFIKMDEMNSPLIYTLIPLFKSLDKSIFDSERMGTHLFNRGIRSLKDLELMSFFFQESPDIRVLGFYAKVAIKYPIWHRAAFQLIREICLQYPINNGIKQWMRVFSRRIVIFIALSSKKNKYKNRAMMLCESLSRLFDSNILWLQQCISNSVASIRSSEWNTALFSYFFPSFVAADTKAASECTYFYNEDVDLKTFPFDEAKGLFKMHETTEIVEKKIIPEHKSKKKLFKTALLKLSSINNDHTITHFDLVFGDCLNTIYTIIKVEQDLITNRFVKIIVNTLLTFGLSMSFSDLNILGHIFTLAEEKFSKLLIRPLIITLKTSQNVFFVVYGVMCKKGIKIEILNQEVSNVFHSMAVNPISLQFLRRYIKSNNFVVLNTLINLFTKGITSNDERTRIETYKAIQSLGIVNKISLSELMSFFKISEVNISNSMLYHVSKALAKLLIRRSITIDKKIIESSIFSYALSFFNELISNRANLELIKFAFRIFIRQFYSSQIIPNINELAEFVLDLSKFDFDFDTVINMSSSFISSIVTACGIKNGILISHYYLKKLEKPDVSIIETGIIINSFYTFDFFTKDVAIASQILVPVIQLPLSELQHQFNILFAIIGIREAQLSKVLSKLFIKYFHHSESESAIISFSKAAASIVRETSLDTEFVTKKTTKFLSYLQNNLEINEMHVAIFRIIYAFYCSRPITMLYHEKMTTFNSFYINEVISKVSGKRFLQFSKYYFLVLLKLSHISEAVFPHPASDLARIINRMLDVNINPSPIVLLVILEFQKYSPLFNDPQNELITQLIMRNITHFFIKYFDNDLINHYEEICSLKSDYDFRELYFLKPGIHKIRKPPYMPIDKFEKMNKKLDFCLLVLRDFGIYLPDCDENIKKSFFNNVFSVDGLSVNGYQKLFLIRAFLSNTNSAQCAPVDGLPILLSAIGQYGFNGDRLIASSLAQWSNLFPQQTKALLSFIETSESIEIQLLFYAEFSKYSHEQSLESQVLVNALRIIQDNHSYLSLFTLYYLAYNNKILSEFKLQTIQILEEYCYSDSLNNPTILYYFKKVLDSFPYFYADQHQSLFNIIISLFSSPYNKTLATIYAFDLLKEIDDLRPYQEFLDSEFDLTKPVPFLIAKARYMNTYEHKNVLLNILSQSDSETIYKMILSIFQNDPEFERWVDVCKMIVLDGKIPSINDIRSRVLSTDLSILLMLDISYLLTMKFVDSPLQYIKHLLTLMEISIEGIKNRDKKINKKAVTLQNVLLKELTYVRNKDGYVLKRHEEELTCIKNIVTDELSSHLVVDYITLTLTALRVVKYPKLDELESAILLNVIELGEKKSKSIFFVRLACLLVPYSKWDENFMVIVNSASNHQIKLNTLHDQLPIVIQAVERGKISMFLIGTLIIEMQSICNDPIIASILYFVDPLLMDKYTIACILRAIYLSNYRKKYKMFIEEDFQEFWKEKNPFTNIMYELVYKLSQLIPKPASKSSILNWKLALSIASSPNMCYKVITYLLSKATESLLYEFVPTLFVKACSDENPESLIFIKYLFNILPNSIIDYLLHLLTSINVCCQKTYRILHIGLQKVGKYRLKSYKLISKYVSMNIDPFGLIMIGSLLSKSETQVSAFVLIRLGALSSIQEITARLLYLLSFSLSKVYNHFNKKSIVTYQTSITRLAIRSLALSNDNDIIIASIDILKQIPLSIIKSCWCSCNQQQQLYEKIRNLHNNKHV